MGIVMPTALASAEYVMYSYQSLQAQQKEDGVIIRPYLMSASLGKGDFGTLHIVSSTMISLMITFIFFDFHLLQCTLCAFLRLLLSLNPFFFSFFKSIIGDGMSSISQDGINQL